MILIYQYYDGAELAIIAADDDVQKCPKIKPRFRLPRSEP